MLSDFINTSVFTCTNYAILLQQFLWITVIGLIHPISLVTDYVYHGENQSEKLFINIPVRTHSVYLPLICECLPLNVQLELRVMKFFYEGF